jgi:hypothetical protein
MQMKSLAFIGLGALALAQTSSRLQIPVWDAASGHYVPVVIGTSLQVVNGRLEVITTSPAIVRKYGAALMATNGTYKLPESAANVVLFQNGLRQSEGIDYQLTGYVVTPLWAWETDAQIRADYDVPR